MLTLSAALPAIAAAQTLPTYHVTELLPPAGATCAITAINDAGAVAGSCVSVSGGANTYGATVWRNGLPAAYGVFGGGTYAQRPRSARSAPLSATATRTAALGRRRS